MEPKELGERLTELCAMSLGVSRLWNDLHSQHDLDAAPPEREHSLLADRLDEQTVSRINTELWALIHSLEALLSSADALEATSEDND